MLDCRATALHGRFLFIRRATTPATDSAAGARRSAVSPTIRGRIASPFLTRSVRRPRIDRLGILALDDPELFKTRSPTWRSRASGR